MQEPFYWIDEISQITLSRGYIEPDNIINHGGTKPATITRLEYMAQTSHDALIKMGKERPGHKEKLMRGWAQGWSSLSTPVMGNYGTDRGLAISCNGSYVSDLLDSILYNYHELGELMRNSAGTSSFFNVRHKGAGISVGGSSGGVVPWMGLAGHYASTITQAGLRRGAFAGYIDIRSNDIHDFLRMRDVGHAVQHVSFGVTIDNLWMEELVAENGKGDKTSIMADIILKRRKSGFPYIFFSDTANESLHEAAKAQGYTIWASNLCTEIMLPANDEETFVCNLSSLNLAKYDEWKNTDWIETMVYFLDTVMQEYIEKTALIPYLKRVNLFSRNWRALGLGTLGYHTALQQKMIPMESKRARELNIEMHKLVQEQSIAASRKMASEYGEADRMKGTGQRHLTLNAIAPTLSSSIILGQVSQSIEPWEANIFENDNAKSSFTQYNKELKKLLANIDKDTAEVWKSIAKAGGSVQHLEFLTPLEKKVFRTFGEIDPKETIKQAADRQKYIDQGQSLNLKVKNDVDMEENMLYIIMAWKLKVKSLYYHKNDTSAARKLLRENAMVTKPMTTLTETQDLSHCVSCEA